MLRGKLEGDDARKALGSFDAAWKQYATRADKAVALSRQETVDQVEERDGSRSIYTDDLLDRAEGVEDRLEALTRITEKGADDTAAAASASASSSSRTLILIAVILDRLQMLQDRCSTDLRNGLNAMADGDLTNTITPVTPLIDDPSADELGQVAEAVNGIRNRTVASVESYNAMTRSSPA